jgi:hypothetical protein
MTKGETWTSVGLTVVALIAGGVIGKVALCPQIGPGDPPIIVHGGSFHLGIYAPTDPGDGSGPIVVAVGKDKVDNIDLGNYQLLDTTKPPLPGLSGAWEVDACDVKGWDITNLKCTSRGLKICSSDSAGACITSGSGTQLTITTLNSGDALARLDGKRRPAPPYNYGYKVTTTAYDDIYHPQFLWVSTASQIYRYTCVPYNYANGGTDWTTCWVALGKY